MVFSCLGLRPCPSHVDLANPVLAELTACTIAGRSFGCAIRDVDGVATYDDVQPQFLLKLIHKVG
jgi:hypothetical protein